MFQGVQGSYRHHGPQLVFRAGHPTVKTVRYLLYIAGEPWTWETFDRPDDYHDWWPFIYTPEFLSTKYFEVIEQMDTAHTAVSGQTLRWPTAVRILKHGDQIGLLQRYVGRRGLDTW